jgi:hypothetical protein
MRITTLMVPAVCVVGLLCSTAGFSAQESGTQPKAGVPVDKPQIDPPQEITATGCLAKEADRFLLTDAAIEITPWVAQSARSAGPGLPKASSSKTVFALQNAQGLEIHVGHRIQVRGVVAPATANLPPSPDTVAERGFTGVPQPTFPGPEAVARVAPPRLDNRDLRMIAASCAGSGNPTKRPARQGK